MSVQATYRITDLAGPWIAGYRRPASGTILLTPEEAEYEVRVGTLIQIAPPPIDPEPTPVPIAANDFVRLLRGRAERNPTVQALETFLIRGDGEIADYLDARALEIRSEAFAQFDPAIDAAITAILGGAAISENTLGKLGRLIAAQAQAIEGLRGRVDGLPIGGGAVPQFGSLDTFGDSIVEKFSASDLAHTWVRVLGAAIKLSPTNHAVSGSMVADQLFAIYSTIVQTSLRQLFIFEIGTNEGFFSGADPARQANFVAMHGAAVAFLAIPERNKLRGQRRARSIVIDSLSHNNAGDIHTIATAHTYAPHGLTTGQAQTISGALQEAYNVTAPVTVIDANTFTFPIYGTPATPVSGGASRATGTEIAYAGAWSPDDVVFGPGMSMRSNANGASATFKAYGDVVYFAYGVHTGNAGRFDVYVDDVLHSSYRADGVQGGMMTTGIHGRDHGSALARLAGLSTRLHTIRIVVVSGTGAGDVWIDWVQTGTPAGSYRFGGPTVLVGGTPQTRDPAFGGIAYAELARRNVARLAMDGLNVQFVDTAAYMDATTDLCPDRIHPYDRGHDNIAQAYLAALNPASTARTAAAIGALADALNPGTF